MKVDGTAICIINTLLKGTTYYYYYYHCFPNFHTKDEIKTNGGYRQIELYSKVVLTL
jgi:hypothetical protein